MKSFKRVPLPLHIRYVLYSYTDIYVCTYLKLLLWIKYGLKLYLSTFLIKFNGMQNLSLLSIWANCNTYLSSFLN